jgi:hypothetical protein
MTGPSRQGGYGQSAGSLAFYKASKAFGWLSIIVSIGIAIFLVTVAYSASGIRYDGVSPLGGSSVPGNVVDFTVTVTLSNPGYYSMDNFHLGLRVVYPQHGLLAVGSSAATSLSAESTQYVPVSFPVNMASPLVRGLLTNDSKLSMSAWVNTTYGYFFPVEVAVAENISWGAPFYGLSVETGTPTVGPNGTAIVPVTIAFSNHSPLPLIGSLSFAVLSAADATCGSGNLNVTALPTEHFDSTTDVTISGGCQPQGGQVVATYTSSLLTATLPPIQVP